jgi:hypothetical protein
LQAKEQGELADHEHNSDKKNVSRETRETCERCKKMERAREGEQTVLGERLRMEGGGRKRPEREREEEERERNKR